MKTRTILILLGLAGIAGCAAPRQAVIPPRPEPRGADSRALGHFIDAKRFKLAGQIEEAVESLRAAIAIDSTSATLYNSLARNLISLNRIAEADEAARRAVRLKPLVPAHRWLLYDTLVKGQRDTLLATAQLEAITRLNPADFRAYARLLQVYTTRRQRQDVLRILDRAASVPTPNIRFNLLIADGYHRLNLPLRTAAIYRRILHRDPEQVQIWNRLGDLTLAGGDTLGAASIYRSGLAHFEHRLNKTTLTLWKKLIAIYDRGDHLEALISETPLDTLFIDRFSVHLPRSIPEPGEGTDLDTLRFRHTEALLNRLLRELPERHDLLGRKASLLLDMDRPEEARQSFILATSLDSDPRYRLGIAHTYLNQQDWDPAIGIFNELFAETPADSDLYARIVFDLGRAYAMSNRTAQARNVYRQAVNARPGDLRFRLAIGRAYLNQRDWDPAIGILNGLFAETPTGSELYAQIVFDLGRAYAMSNRTAQARNVYRQAVNARPGDLRFRLAVGRTYLAEKSWEAAIPELEGLLSRLEDDAELLEDVLYDLGHGYERAGRFDSAVAVFQRLLARAPDNHQALNYLGYMFAEKGVRLGEAEGYIERALRGDPHNGAYLDSMGWVYFQQQRYDEAMRFLKLALKAEESRLNEIEMEFRTAGQLENLSIILDHVGDAARALGNIDEALEHWRRAADLNPENDSIRRKLQSVRPNDASGP